MSSSTRVIAICGKHGSGKDAIAAALASCDDGMGGFVNFKLAGPLKDAVRLLFSFEESHVEGSLKDVVHPAWGVTPRALMQWFGTEVMQHELAKVVPSVGRRFWADRLVRSVDKFFKDQQSKDGTPAPGDIAVITDMRFRHEFDALREAFGDRLVAVRVERRESAGWQELAAYGSDAERLHESELASSSLPVDLVIENDGSLAQLEAVARGVLRFGRIYPQKEGGANKTARLLSARCGSVVYVREGDDDATPKTCSPQKWMQKYGP